LFVYVVIFFCINSDNYSFSKIRSVRNKVPGKLRNIAEKQQKLANYRQPPNNIEAEQLIIGAILTNNEAINKIGDFLRPEHFYEPIHQRIYESILRFNDRGLIADPVTLRNYFDKDEGLSDLGGASYLAKIAGMASGIINVMDLASIVYSLAISRSLIDIGEEVVNHAYDSSGELRASEQIEKAEHKLFQLASEGNSDSYFAHLKSSLSTAITMAEAATKQEEAITGVPTGFTDLDNLLGGLHNSDLIILAARPSMGKTALAVNIALNAAKSLKKKFEKNKREDEDNAPREAPTVGVFSLEMSSEQLATRLLSMETDISSTDIRRGRLSKGNKGDDFEKLLKAQALLHDMPIFIDDTPALSISAIRTRARRLKRKHNLSLLVIDYLQLIRGVSSVSMNSRVQEISEITMGLKAIAKELNIPVVALSQLSRAVEQRDDKRPHLSDLRESGTIEQDADVVMFIYREEYYLERVKPSNEASEKFLEWKQKFDQVEGVAEISIAKHRNGPVGTRELLFHKETTKFGDLIKEDHLPEHHY